jgi:hypothetical protein
MQRQTGFRRSVTALVALAVVALALPAQAAFVDDPPYARGPLDLKRLIANKHSAGSPLLLTVVTYGNWKAKLLDVDGPNRIFVLFNPDREGDEDFIGEIFFRDGGLRMRITKPNGTFVRAIRAYHPTGHSVHVTVPRGLPNPDGHTWLAAGEEYTTPDGPCSQTCQDRVPGHGWLKLTPGL